MMKLKFLIFVLGLFMVQGVLAVQLPSTSFNPYVTSGGAYDSQSSDEVGIGTVGYPSRAFLMLGSADFDCSSKYDTFSECVDCCSKAVSDCYKDCGGDADCKEECNASNLECANDCGRSLPLDAPLWYMLALAAVGAAFSVALRKKLI